MMKLFPLFFLAALFLLAGFASAAFDGTKLIIEMHFEGDLEVIRNKGVDASPEAYTVNDSGGLTYVDDGVSGKALHLAPGEHFCVLSTTLATWGDPNDFGVSFWIRNHAYTNTSPTAAGSVLLGLKDGIGDGNVGWAIGHGPGDGDLFLALQDVEAAVTTTYSSRTENDYVGAVSGSTWKNVYMLIEKDNAYILNVDGTSNDYDGTIPANNNKDFFTAGQKFCVNEQSGEDQTANDQGEFDIDELYGWSNDLFTEADLDTIRTSMAENYIPYTSLAGPPTISGHTDNTPGATNTLTVTLDKGDFGKIYQNANDLIVIEGLVGMATPSSATHPILTGAKFAASGVWDQDAGTLTLAFATSDNVNGAASFTFNLQNPSVARSPIRPTLRIKTVAWRHVLTDNSADTNKIETILTGIAGPTLAIEMHFEDSLEVIRETATDATPPTYTINDSGGLTYVTDGVSGKALHLAQGQHFCISSSELEEDKWGIAGKYIEDWGVSFWLRNHAFTATTPTADGSVLLGMKDGIVGDNDGWAIGHGPADGDLFLALQKNSETTTYTTRTSNHFTGVVSGATWKNVFLIIEKDNQYKLDVDGTTQDYSGGIGAHDSQYYKTGAHKFCVNEQSSEDQTASDQGEFDIDELYLWKGRTIAEADLDTVRTSMAENYIPYTSLAITGPNPPTLTGHTDNTALGSNALTVTIGNLGDFGNIEEDAAVSVIVEGLTGLSTATNAALAITSGGGVYATTGNWDQTAGRLTVALLANQIISGDEAFTFTLANPNGPLTSRTVTVRVSTVAWRHVISTPGGADTSDVTTTAPPIPVTINAPPAITKETGLDALTLAGAGFGTDGTVNIGTFGACPKVTWTDTEIVCTAPEGAGTGLTLSVDVGPGTHYAPQTGTIDYRAPKVTAVAVAGGVAAGKLPTAGSGEITISGWDFGPTAFTDYSVAVNFPGGAVLCSAYDAAAKSNTVLVCDASAPAGVGASLALVVSAGAQAATGSPTVDYDVPDITDITPKNHAALPGATVFTIDGASMGGNAQGSTYTVFIGTHDCTPVTLQSDTQITCPLPAGYGNAQSVSVTIAGQTATQSGGGAFSYDAPSVTDVVPGTLPADNAAAVDVTIKGFNFGTAAKLPSAVTFNGVACASISSVTDTEFTCDAPDGFGTGVDVVVTQTGQSNPTTTDQFSYGAPTVSAIDPPTGSTLGHPTAGAQTFTIRGTNLGSTSNALPAPTIQIGPDNRAFTGCAWADDTYFTCTGLSEGIGQALGVTVNYGGETFSATDKFSYGLPQVTHVEVNGQVAGTIVTLYGANFGGSSDMYASCTALGGSLDVSIGGTAVTPAPTWHANSADPYIKVTVPTGTGNDKEVLVTWGTSYPVATAVASTNPGRYSYSPPTISHAEPRNAGSLGGSIMTIWGTGFGLLTVTQKGIIDRTTQNIDCTRLVYSSDTKFTCTIGGGVGENLEVKAFADGAESSDKLTNWFTYDAPTYTANVVDGGAASSVGGTVVTLHGTGFGPDGTQQFDFQVDGRSSPSTCTTVALSLGTKITCQVPAGAGQGWVPTLKVGNRAAISCVGAGCPIDYVDPVISSISAPVSKPTSGGFVITVTGNHFGIAAASHQATVYLNQRTDNNKCTAVITSNTEFECTIPKGYGQGVDVEVDVRVDSAPNVLASAVAADKFTFNQPAVTHLDPAPPYAAAGQASVTIWGTSFGVPGTTTMAGTLPEHILGSTTCTTTGAVTQPAGGVDSFYFVCDFPAGFGVNLDIDLTTAGGAATTAQFSAVNSADKYSYAAMTLGTVTPATGATDGVGYRLTITGTNFGPARTLSAGQDRVRLEYRDTVAVVNADFVLANCAITVAQTQIECDSGPGVGLNLDVDVRLGLSATTDDEVELGAGFAFVAADVTGVTPASASAGTTLTVQGTNFGNAANLALISVDVGPGSCTPTAASMTAIECTLDAGGAGQGLTVAVSVGLNNEAQTDSIATAFSYPGPQLTHIVPATPKGTSQMNNAITIYGKNFGTNDGEIELNFLTDVNNPVARVCANPDINRSGCTSAPHECVVCRRPDGVGKDIDIRATVGPGGSTQFSSTIKFSYEAPDMNNAYPSPIEPVNLGNYLTLDGLYFGPGALSDNEAATDPVVMIDPTGVVGGPKPCTVLAADGTGNLNRRKSDTRVVCAMPDWVGSALEVQICVAAHCNTPSLDAKISFHPPDITSLSVNRVDPDGSIAARTITIHGNRFGPPLVGAPVSATVGGTACVTFTHVSDDEIHCEVPPGAGHPRNVVVTSGNQFDTETNFGYTAPLYTSVVPSLVYTSGLTAALTQDVLTITGKHFGVPTNLHPVLVEIGDGALTTACTPISHISDTEIRCNVPDWGGQNLDIEITIDGQILPNTDKLSYRAPAINLTSVVWSYPDTGYNGPEWTTNGVFAPNFPNPKITITGTSFGSSASPFFASSGFTSTIGTWPFTVIHSHGHTEIVASVPYGLGASQSIEVTYGGQQSPNLPRFTYRAPDVTGVSPRNGPKKGGTLISIFGRNFGMFPPNQLNVSISDLLCENATWYSDTLVECVTGNMLLASVTLDFDNLRFPGLVLFSEYQHSVDAEHFTYLEFTSPYCADQVEEEFPSGKTQRLNIGVEYFKNIAPYDDLNMPNKLAEIDRPIRAQLTSPRGTLGCADAVPGPTTHCYPTGDQGADRPGDLVDDDRCCKKYVVNPCGIHFPPALEAPVGTFASQIINIIMNMRSQARIVGTLTSFFNPCENEPLPFFEIYFRPSGPGNPAIPVTGPVTPATDVPNLHHRRATGVSDTPCDVIPGNSGAMSICVDWFDPITTTMLRLKFDNQYNFAAGGWIMEFEVYGIFEQSPYQLHANPYLGHPTTLKSDFTTQFAYQLGTFSVTDVQLDGTQSSTVDSSALVLTDTETEFMFATIQGPGEGVETYVPLQQDVTSGNPPEINGVPTMGLNESLPVGAKGLFVFASLNLTTPKAGNYTLTFVSPGLKSESHMVTVIVGDPNTIQVRRGEPDIEYTKKAMLFQLLPTYIVEAYDPGLNVVTYPITYGDITVQCFQHLDSPYFPTGTCGHSDLYGSTVVTMVNGVATFSNATGTPVFFREPGSQSSGNTEVNYELRFSSPTLGDTMEYVKVLPGRPAALFIEDTTPNTAGVAHSSITLPAAVATPILRGWTDITPANPGSKIITKLMDTGYHPIYSLYTEAFSSLRDYYVTIDGDGQPGIPTLTSTPFDSVAVSVEWSGMFLATPKVGTYTLSFRSDGPLPVLWGPLEGLSTGLRMANLTVTIVYGRVVTGVVTAPQIAVPSIASTALPTVTVVGIDGGGNSPGVLSADSQCTAFFNTSDYPLEGPVPVFEPGPGRAGGVMLQATSTATYTTLSVTAPRARVYYLSVDCAAFDDGFPIPFTTVEIVFGPAVSLVTGASYVHQVYPTAPSFDLNDIEVNVVDAGGNTVFDDMGTAVTAEHLTNEPLFGGPPGLVGSSVNGSYTFTGLQWQKIPEGTHYINFTSPGLVTLHLNISVGIGAPVKLRVKSIAQSSYPSKTEVVLDAISIVGVDAGGSDVEGVDTQNRTVSVTIVDDTTGLPALWKTDAGPVGSMSVSMNDGIVNIANTLKLASPARGAYTVTFTAIDSVGVDPVSTVINIGDGPVVRATRVGPSPFSTILSGNTSTIYLETDWDTKFDEMFVRGLDAGERFPLDLKLGDNVQAQVLLGGTPVPWAAAGGSGGKITTGASPLVPAQSDSGVAVAKFSNLRLAAPPSGVYTLRLTLPNVLTEKYPTDIPVVIGKGIARTLGTFGDTTGTPPLCSFANGCDITLLDNTTVALGPIEILALNAAREPVYGIDTSTRQISYSMEYVEMVSLSHPSRRPNFTTSNPTVPDSIFVHADTTMNAGVSPLPDFKMVRPYVGEYRIRLSTPNLGAGLAVDDGFVKVVIRPGPPRALRVEVPPAAIHEETIDGRAFPNPIVIWLTDILDNPVPKPLTYSGSVTARAYHVNVTREMLSNTTLSAPGGPLTEADLLYPSLGAGALFKTSETSVYAMGEARFVGLEFHGIRDEDYYIEFNAAAFEDVPALIPARSLVRVRGCNQTVANTVRDSVLTTKCVCAPGFYKPDTKKELQPDQCSPCPNGYYKSDMGNKECTKCDQNKDTNRMNTVRLPDSPDGTAASNKNRCTCEPGFYMTEKSVESPATTDWCSTCPEGGECTGGFAIYPVPGYWRTNANSTQFFECPNPAACTGGANATCKEGHAGALCSVCLDGYGKVGEDCQKCPKQTYAWPLFAGSVLLIFGIVAFLIRSQKNTNWDYTTPTVIQKILLNYLQMLSLFGNFDIQWPPEVRQMFEVSEGSSSLSQDVFTVDCAVQTNYYFKLLTYLLIPILAVIVPLAIFLAWHFFRRGLGIIIRRPYYGTIGDALNGSLLATMIIIFMTHPTVSRQVFNVFNCVEMDGIVYLQEDLSILCDENDSEYRFWRQISFIALFAFCLGVPIYGFILLYFLRNKLSLASTRSRFGFLYIGLDPRRFYWEMLTILRKLSIVYCVVFIKTKAVHQVFAALWVIQIAMLGHLFLRPYEAELAQRLELASLFSGFVTLMMGLMFEPDVQFDKKLTIYFMIGLILINGTTFICLVTFLIRGKVLMRLTKAERVIDWKKVAAEVFDEDAPEAKRDLYQLFTGGERHLQDPATSNAYKEPMRAVVSEMMVDNAIPMDVDDINNIPNEVVDAHFQTLPDVDKAALDAIARSLAPDVDVNDTALGAGDEDDDLWGGDWGEEWDEEWFEEEDE